MNVNIDVCGYPITPKLCIHDIGAVSNSTMSTATQISSPGLNHLFPLLHVKRSYKTEAIMISAVNNQKRAQPPVNVNIDVCGYSITHVMATQISLPGLDHLFSLLHSSDVTPSLRSNDLLLCGWADIVEHPAYCSERHENRCYV